MMGPTVVTWQCDAHWSGHFPGILKPGANPDPPPAFNDDDAPPGSWFHGMGIARAAIPVKIAATERKQPTREAFLPKVGSVDCRRRSGGCVPRMGAGEVGVKVARRSIPASIWAASAPKAR